MTKLGNLLGGGCTVGCAYARLTPRLDLVDSGEPCSIWGRGQRPGTFGRLLIDHPDLLQEYLAWRAEKEAKRERFEKWRKQLEDSNE